MFWTVLCARAAAASSAAPTVPDYVIKYAPLLHLHSADPFRPSDLLRHVRHTTPRVDFAPVSGPESNGSIVWDLDNLKDLNRFGAGGYNVSLTSKDNAVADPVPSWLLGTEPDQSAQGLTRNATPCVVVLVERTPQDLDAFYFYFYSFNRGQNISQVREPINRMVRLDGKEGTAFGDHVGDWWVHLYLVAPFALLTRRKGTQHGPLPRWEAHRHIFQPTSRRRSIQLG